jgi:alpha-1,3-rhamnosyl/mannosyltransferase
MPRIRVGTPVVTVHDLQYLAFPHFFRLTKLAYLRTAVPRAVRRASVVTVPSAFVAGTVADAFHYPVARVVVVPHGLDASVGASTGPAHIEAARRHYGLSDPYVVYPAVTHPHKNHDLLLQAMAALRATEPDLRLLLLGGSGLAENDVRAQIDALDLDKVVVRPGRVPAAERDALVAGAEALVFPSRYEGFGAPVIEAMRLGCPVLAATGTALPEVVGPAGLLLDPLDVDAWVDAIVRVRRDPMLRAELVTAGHERAATFTAARSAAALLDAYRLART